MTGDWKESDEVVCVWALEKIQFVIIGVFICIYAQE